MFRRLIYVLKKRTEPELDVRCVEMSTRRRFSFGQSAFIFPATPIRRVGSCAGAATDICFCVVIDSHARPFGRLTFSVKRFPAISAGQRRRRGPERQRAAVRRLRIGSDRRAGERGHRIGDIHGARYRPGRRRQRRGALRAGRVHARTHVLPGGPRPRHHQPGARARLRDGAPAYRHGGGPGLGLAAAVRQHDAGGGRAGRQRQRARVRAAALRGHRAGIVAGRLAGKSIGTAFDGLSSRFPR